MINFKHPFTCLIAGATSSGKTRLVRDILRHHHSVIAGISEPILKVLWCYGINQPLYQQLIPGVEIIYNEGIVDEATLGHLQCHVIVIDDLMNEVNENLCNLFTRGSHHLGISVVFIVQNLFAKGKVMRTISLNSQIVILMKNPRDKSQIATFGRQVFPGKVKYFLEAYEDATSKLFGYLVFDLSPYCEDSLRLRTSIIPIKGLLRPVVYLSK